MGAGADVAVEAATAVGDSGPEFHSVTQAAVPPAARTSAIPAAPIAIGARFRLVFVTMCV